MNAKAREEEASNSQSNIEKYDAEPTATKTEKTLGTSAADKIIAHELMQAPPRKFSIVKRQMKSHPKRRKRKKEFISTKRSNGCLTVLIIGAFGIIVYWMLAPESTDTEIKPLYNQSSSTGNNDAIANDSNNKDTLTLAEKALLLAQQDQATDSDDSDKYGQQCFCSTLNETRRNPSNL